MLRPIALIWIFMFILAVGAAGAQGPPGGGPVTAAPSQSASITNPAISVIGWFESVAGNDTTTQSDAFALREAELGLQAAVDPFTRADFFLSAGPEGLDVEEGYITWLAMPGGGQAKIGKFRADLGKFNRTHPPETPFADRPLAAEAFLGEEGLAVTGIAASALLPNPADLYWDVVANVGTAPSQNQSPLFGPERRDDLLALGRTSVFIPVRESTDLNLGLSYANARSHPDLRAEGERAQVGVLDVTLHWKNPRRSIYRSLIVQGELLGERGSADGAPTRHGGYGYAIWQVARQWKVGARLDRTEAPGTSDLHNGALALVQYQPSEFSTLSLQLRRVHDDATRSDRDAAFFKWTFNIGPHGAHPY
jgi:hypothetical protein